MQSSLNYLLIYIIRWTNYVEKMLTKKFEIKCPMNEIYLVKLSQWFETNRSEEVEEEKRVFDPFLMWMMMNEPMMT